MTTTKIVKRFVMPDGSFTEETTEPLCSVELKLLAKGTITVESVKVYAENEVEAGTRAQAEMERQLAWVAAKNAGRSA